MKKYILLLIIIISSCTFFNRNNSETLNSKRIDDISELLILDPNNINLRLELSDLYKEDSLYELALLQIDSSKLLKGITPEILLKEGQVLIEMGHSEIAISPLSQAFYFEPDNKEIILYYGIALSITSNHRTAIELLTEYINRENNAQAYYYLSASLYSIGATDKAWIYLNKATDFYPDDSSLIILYSKISLKFNKQYYAEEKLKKFLSKYENISALICLSKIYFSSRRIDETIETLEKALALDSLNYNVNILYAKILEYSGKKSLALERWKRALEIYPNSVILTITFAKSLYDNGRIDQSLQVYKKAIELDIERPEPYYQLGNILHQLERNDEAIQYFITAIELENNNAVYLTRMGAMTYNLGYYNLTDKAFNKAISIDSTNMNEYLIILAKIHTQKGNFYKADSILNKINSSGFESEELYNTYAQLYGAQGHYKDAAINFEKAAEVCDSFSRSKYLLASGINYILSNNQLKTNEIIHNLQNIAPEYADSLEYLSIINEE